MKKYGIERLMDFEGIPCLSEGVTVHYEGSIDKTGFNADWDWWLYKENKEWVIFDVEGPGCIYNFVQHRYPTSEDVIFRFYFDGENTPRLQLKHSEFGMKAPFIEPLASQYIGPDDNGRGPIRVVRSFVPMPYNKSCKITTSVRLKGYSKEKGDGGWGHVIYHSYTENENIETFTGLEDYNKLFKRWNRIGEDPKNCKNNKVFVENNIVINPSEEKNVFQKQGSGSLSSIKVELEHFQQYHLSDVWIRMAWDNHDKPDILCPIGAFFGNELGFNSVEILSHGITKDGEMFNYFPMPFWENAKIELWNKGNKTVKFKSIELQWKEENTYSKEKCGYFRSSDYYARKAVEGRDSIIADIKGKGHLVAAQVTAYAKSPGVISCEGDVRVYIDDSGTPQVESDGSESWICYGWGFATPPCMNPISAYDGLPDNPWSMVRICLGDYYPFESNLRFGIESGESNNQYLEHSGIIFYYGIDKPGIIFCDELDIGNRISELQHEYKCDGERNAGSLTAYYEGDKDKILITDYGREVEGYSEFKVIIEPKNRGVRLRRRFDQITGRQRAKVFVDGIMVTEREWYYADRNPYKRWADDDFEIPYRYTQNKSRITVRIEFAQEGENRTWNEYNYKIFSYIN